MNEFSLNDKLFITIEIVMLFLYLGKRKSWNGNGIYIGISGSGMAEHKVR